MRKSAKKISATLAVFSLLFVMNSAQVAAKSSDINYRKLTKWDYYSYKYVGDKLQRNILPSQDFVGCDPCSWTTKDARNDQNFESIRVQSFKAIKAFRSNKKASPAIIEWLITKNTNPSLAKIYKKLNADAINYWQSEIISPLPYRLLIGTERDRTEVKAILSKTENGLKSLPMMNNFFDRYSRLQDYEKDRPVGGGMPEKDKLISNGRNVYQVVYHVGSFTTDQKVFVTTPAHEITHVLQINRSKAVGYEKNMPVSLWEGSAVLFGAGIPMPNIAWYSDELDHQLFRFLSNFATKIAMKNEADVIKLLTMAEKPNSEVSIEAGYYVGAVFFEWLIAKHGVQKFLNLLDAAATSQSFNDAMLKTYGETKNKIYAQSASYVLKNYKRVLEVFNS
jgi:hypothetical protein